MLWVSFTMLGRRKRRKKRGGITVYRPRKPMYGRPNGICVYSQAFQEGARFSGINLEQMKSIVIQRSSAKCFEQWGMQTSSCFLSTSGTSNLAQRAIIFVQTTLVKEGLIMKTALFTVSYNRPDLMQELLHGLATNAEDLDGIDVFHYVDGGPKSKQDEIKSTIEQSDMPCTSIILREENYLDEISSVQADLFDVHGYERVLLIEDDLIPGPNFIKTTLALLIGRVNTTMLVWFKFGIPKQPFQSRSLMLLFQRMSTSTPIALMWMFGRRSSIPCMNTNVPIWKGFPMRIRIGEAFVNDS